MYQRYYLLRSFVFRNLRIQTYSLGARRPWIQIYSYKSSTYDKHFKQQILFFTSCVDFANFLYHIGCLTSYFLFMHQQKKKLSTLNPHLHIFIDRYMKVVTTVGGWWRKWEICVLILRNAHKSTFSHNVLCSNNVVCLWQYILFKLSLLQNGKFCSYHEFKKCKEFIIF